MAKWNYEKMKEYVESFGFELISNAYNGLNGELKFICSNGHDNTTYLKLLKSNTHKCPYCAGIRIHLNDIKERFEQEGFKLLSTRYVNAKEKLDYICSNGHKRSTTWDDFRSGKRCKSCYLEDVNKGDYLKLTYKEVNDSFGFHGYVLLEKEYVNSLTPMKCICPSGHTTERSLSGVRGGGGCRECRQIASGNSLRLKIEDVRSLFESKGLELISDTYQNSVTPLRYKCSCGNISSTTVDRVKANGKCAKCARERQNITYYLNGSQKCSFQQKYLSDLYKGELNYPCRYYSIDIALINEGIAIEYNGGGHWLSILHGTMTEDEFEKREIKRNYTLNYYGWKVIEIDSREDLFPSDQKLLEMLNFSRGYLKNHSWIKFDIDNSTVRGSSISEKYDYGELIHSKRMKIA